ncbi:MAG: cellulose synthase operon protein YhjQ/BcsQ [Acidobacteriota bacterium]
MSSRNHAEPEITALLICPNRELASQFLETLPQVRAFQLLADMKSYPPQQTLEIRVKQLKPQVVLLDLATDLALALDLIRDLAAFSPPIQVVGLHTHNDSQTIVQSVRAGAVEFFHSPFDLSTQREALVRLRRMTAPETPLAIKAGYLVGFSSSKPGSGASTLATQIAFSLQRLTGKRILLVDCDLTGGTIGFYLKLSHSHSLVDALEQAGNLDLAAWNELTVNYGGVDILPAPAAPYADPIDPTRLRMVADAATKVYDWVLLDLPTVFSKMSLMVTAECDRSFMVSTAELPSLHLTRKAVNLLNQLGFPPERFHVVVNRVDRHDDIKTADMERLFGCPVHARLPNDYFALHRVVTLGQPLGTESELGRSVEAIAGRLCESLGQPGGPPSAPGTESVKPAGATRQLARA